MNRELEFDVQDTSIREAKHQSGGRGSLTLPPGLPMFRPKKKGVITIDVIAFQATDKILTYLPNLQFADPGKWYGEQTYWRHGGIGVNNETYTCPAATFGKRCPVCDDGGQMRSSSKDDAVRDRGFELKAKQRQLFLVFDHDDPQSGIQLWEEAYHNFGKQLDEFINASRPEMKPRYKAYYHPTAGFTLRVSASEEPMGGKGRKGGGQQGGGGGGTYASYTPVELYPRARPIPVEMFRHGIDLSAIPRLMPYADLLAVYKGHDVDEPDQQAAGQGVIPGPRYGDGTNGDRARPNVGGADPYAGLFSGTPAAAPPPVQHHPNLPPQDARGFPVYTQPGMTPPPASAWDDGPGNGVAPDGDDEFYKDDEVEFEYRGQVMAGTVESVDPARRVVRLTVPGEVNLRTVMFEDAKLVPQAGGAQSAPPPAAYPSVAPPAGLPPVDDFAPPPRRAAPAPVPPQPIAPPVDDAAPPPRRRAALQAAPVPVANPEPPAPRTRTRQAAPPEPTDDNPPAPRRRKT